MMTLTINRIALAGRGERPSPSKPLSKGDFDFPCPRHLCEVLPSTPAGYLQTLPKGEAGSDKCVGGRLDYTTKPGLGSNGEDQRERDVYKYTGSPRPETKWPFAGGQEESSLQTELLHQSNRKTGYAPAEDNRQVPSPIHFPFSPCAANTGAFAL